MGRASHAPWQPERDDRPAHRRRTQAGRISETTLGETNPIAPDDGRRSFPPPVDPIRWACPGHDQTSPMARAPDSRNEPEPIDATHSGRNTITPMIVSNSGAPTGATRAHRAVIIRPNPPRGSSSFGGRRRPASGAKQTQSARPLPGETNPNRPGLGAKQTQFAPVADDRGARRPRSEWGRHGIEETPAGSGSISRRRRPGSASGTRPGGERTAGKGLAPPSAPGPDGVGAGWSRGCRRGSGRRRGPGRG
ncbi:hypothetical protein ElP_39360 [Tautonia plasticadhaerens]|uniref:Uncharacterized protein n=1 Tax=Tautonia plasticadhaerens TaxID=2527974 RepID=A0A518H5A7_9BACT|nr:hypothetical protein ElP_39360 [Tautonia plasticadhaerens]